MKKILALLLCVFSVNCVQADNGFKGNLYLAQDWLDRHNIWYDEDDIVYVEQMGDVYVIENEVLNNLPLPVYHILFKYIRATQVKQELQNHRAQN